MERLIIETHSQKKQILQKTVTPKTTLHCDSKIEDKKTENRGFPGPELLNPEEIQQAGEKMESDRSDFLTQMLDLSEEKILQHKKFRHHFLKATSVFWQSRPLGELSLMERRKLLEAEERYHLQLEKLYGKEKLKKYESFREKYNQKGFKKQMHNGEAHIFMGL